MNNIRVLSVFGTRPEAIKMAPLALELGKRDGIVSQVCVTAQHRQMLDQVLETFGVVPDYDLNIMKDRQTLFDITTNVLYGIKEVLEKVKPDVVLVHGDTSTTFVAALACFYLQIPVGHVEAGIFSVLCDCLEQFCALPAVAAIVGVDAVPNLRPKRRISKRLVVYGLRESIEGIHYFGKVAVVGTRGVRGNYLVGMWVAPCRQLHDADIGFVARQILGPYPYPAQELLVSAALEHRAAEEISEAELLRRGGLSNAVVAVEVVVERMERTVAQAARVRLNAHHLSVGFGPARHLLDVVQPSVGVASGVEGVEQVFDVAERDGRRYIHVYAEPDLQGREAESHDFGDKWGSRGQMVGE